MSGETRAGVVSGKMRVGDRELDFDDGVLRASSGETIDLRPQVWQVLRLLAVRAGSVVTKDELLAEIWPGLVVTDGSITQAVSDVRSALGEAGHSVIKTIPRRGYMLVGRLSTERPEHSASERASATSPTPLPSVAVLPLGDPVGGEAGQQLARGFAHDLIAELARNVGLRIISHHSSFALADEGRPLAEIGERLRCRHIVDGSVRRDGEALRVVVELIDSESGEVLWSQRYTATSANAIAHRNALVERIAGTVLSRVTQMRERAALTQPAKNMDVYTMTLRGIALRRETTAASLRAGRALLEQALATDPAYGRAWVALGHLNYVDIWTRLTGERRMYDAPEAAAQVERGIELGFEEAEAYIALSLVRRTQRRFAEALAEAQRAVELGPGDTYAWHNLATSQLHCGHCGAALCSAERALDFNPLPSAHGGHTVLYLASALWANRRYDEAIRSATESHVKLPSLWVPLAFRMYAFYEAGQVDKARIDAMSLLARLPRLTATKLALQFADEAVEMRQRVIAAARGSGIP